MSKQIFISHAEVNKDLADKLVDLMESGIGIPDNDVFCSSLEGLGVPSGTNFIDFIKNQISHPRVVILLLTQEYFNSQFCLSELGATWVLSHKMIPLLVPPLQYKDVKAILTGVQVLKVADSSDLNQMQEELVSSLGIKGKPFARWEIKRQKFLGDIKDILSATPARKTVSVAEYDDLKVKYEEAVGALAEMEDDITEKDTLIGKLQAAKNADEVKDIMVESLDEPEAFEQFVDEVKEALDTLPSVVQEAIYYHYRNENLPRPNAFDDYKKDEITQAVEEDFLTEYDEDFSLVEDDPNIDRVLLALSDLDEYIKSIDESSEFHDYYIEHYDHKLNLKSRRFWETHLW